MLWRYIMLGSREYTEKYYELVGADRYISRLSGHCNTDIPPLQIGFGARLSRGWNHHRSGLSRAHQQDRYHPAYCGIRHRTPDVRHRSRTSARSAMGAAPADLRLRVRASRGNDPRDRFGHLFRFQANLAVRTHHRLRSLDVLYRVGAAIVGRTGTTQFSIWPLFI